MNQLHMYLTVAQNQQEASTNPAIHHDEQDGVQANKESGMFVMNS